MKKKIFLLLLFGLILTGVAVFVVMPRYIRHAATQKPADVTLDQFVTAPAPTANLGQRVEQSLQETPPPREVPPPSSEPAPIPATHHTGEPTPASGAPSQPSSSAIASATAHAPSRPTPEATIPLQPQPTGPKTFKVQVSEQEVSGLIYNGVMQRTLPQYRSALKGVATQLNNGTAKITVALEPRHLPDDMLRNFPGIDRNSPTIYVGGEVGLKFDQNTIYPDIQNISLGSMRIPTAIIKSLIKYEIHQHIRQMIQLQSGQQAQLTDVSLNNGALTIEGLVQSF